MPDMAGIPEALVALLLSTLDPGMTKQVLKVEEEEDTEMRLEREENAKLYHLVAGRHLVTRLVALLLLR